MGARRSVIFLLGLSVVAGTVVTSHAKDEGGPTGHTAHHAMMQSMGDGRISLGLSPEMKQHQLSNMRSHFEAVQSIVALMAEGEFDKASQTAHSQLGLTEEMRQMCDMFADEQFRKLGLAFHASGDALGDVLQTGDLKKSLHALQATMGYCVQCHATYRQ